MYERSIVATLVSRMEEPRKFLQVLRGPRQTGKTTAIKQALSKLTMPFHYVSADNAGMATQQWLTAEWQQARQLTQPGTQSAVLVIDEVQNVTQWSSVVKALWDEDAWNNLDLRVVLSGSSSLLLQSGLAESLMGRFEQLYSSHWTYGETKAAFEYTLDDFLFFGGYPASAHFRQDPQRWVDYMGASVIEATLSRDVLQREDVRKPAVLRALFYMGTSFSAQELSFRKMLGQLDDAGNTVTIAHYLDLLAEAGLLQGLQKFDPKLLRKKSSSPRLMVYDTALVTAVAGAGAQELLTKPDKRGHLVESAVGAYLIARSKQEHFEVLWWREGANEVDFVLQKGAHITAIEVKSGRVKSLAGMTAFLNAYPDAHRVVVGSADCPLEDFLLGKVALF
ncbi:MAG: ATP-binding protein [Raoultibacter sp.]